MLKFVDVEAQVADFRGCSLNIRRDGESVLKCGGGLQDPAASMTVTASSSYAARLCWCTEPQCWVCCTCEELR